MRTVTYQSVIWGVAYKMGLDPRINLNANVAAAINEYVNSRSRFAWEKMDWPEIVIIEARTPSSGLVAWKQSGQTLISDVFKVYRADPRTNPPPLDVYFQTDQLGIHIGPTEQIGSTVYVKYRTLPPVFTSVQWVTGATYATGALVYCPSGPGLAGDGNVYQNLTGTNSGNPVGDATNWVLVPMPYFLSEYVKTAAFSDAQREDGQESKAAAEEQRSSGIVADAANAQAAGEFDAITQNIKMAARGPSAGGGEAPTGS